MKTLLLIRHAKSSWDDEKLADFDRPLNDRGKHDAPRMGKWLKIQEEIPDLIICSPAKRTRKTAKKIGHEIGYYENAIVFDPGLYETNVETYLQRVCTLPPEKKKVFLVGHNNTITQFANYLCGTEIENIPTCGIVKIIFSIDNWNEVSIHSGDFQWFQFPKNLPDTF